MPADALEFFCRHLIGIGWYEGPVNKDKEFSQKPTFWSASGFLLRINKGQPNSSALITAGHVFTEFRNRTSRQNYAAKNFNLFDIWGPNSTYMDPIPFNMFEYKSYEVCDEAAGRDFAIVQLPPIILRNLSQTITPFRKVDLVNQVNMNFDYYAMLGLPNEDAEQIEGRTENLKMVTTFQNPALLPLEPCQLPAGISPASNPQFVARVSSGGLGSIVGMSGGPILGFKMTTDGQLKYWPVAIQSGWFSESRIVVGTLIPPIASEIEQFIDETL